MKIRTTLAALAAVTLLGGLAACGDDDEDTEAVAPPPAAAPETPAAEDPSAAPEDSAATITMVDNAFEPMELTTEPGATIEVVNEGAARHNLTNGEQIDSGDVAAGESTTITAPSEPGDYDFKCTYHFGMEGVLKVS